MRRISDTCKNCVCHTLRDPLFVRRPRGFSIFISIQFPVYDARLFFVGETGHLRKPNWPIARPSTDFMRGVGGVKSRYGGGLDGWIGEGVYCDARNLIKFSPDTFSSRDSSFGTATKILRRFYSDGLAVSRFEIALAIKPETGRNRSRGLPPELHALNGIDLASLFASRVVLPRSRESLSLVNIGPALARAYLASTTRNSVERSPLHDRLVGPANPVIFIEESRPVSAHRLFREYRRIDCRLGNFLCGKLNLSRGQARVWHFNTNSSGLPSRDLVRAFRISLLRLHTEQECLRNLLNLVADGTLSNSETHENSQRLQWYLNDSIRRMSGIKNYKIWNKAGFPGDSPLGQRLLRDLLFDDIGGVYDMADPSERTILIHALKRQLRELNFRPNVERKVLDYATQVLAPELTGSFNRSDSQNPALPEASTQAMDNISAEVGTRRRVFESTVVSFALNAAVAIHVGVGEANKMKERFDNASGRTRRVRKAMQLIGRYTTRQKRVSLYYLKPFPKHSVDIPAISGESPNSEGRLYVNMDALHPILDQHPDVVKAVYQTVMDSQLELEPSWRDLQRPIFACRHCGCIHFIPDSAGMADPPRPPKCDHCKNSMDLRDLPMECPAVRMRCPNKDCQREYLERPVQGLAAGLELAIWASAIRQAENRCTRKNCRGKLQKYQDAAFDSGWAELLAKNFN